MQPYTNLHFLSLLLRGDGERAAAAMGRDPERMTSFIEFVGRNHLWPLVHRLIPEAGVESTFSSKWLARLDEFSAQQLARKEGLVAVLAELRDLFEREGVDFTLLKGPYVAHRFFGGLGGRFFSDLDLFVREATLPDVERLLRASGFERKSATPFGRSLTAPFVHALDFGRHGVTLDLHWRLSAHISFRIDYDAVWGSRGRYAIDGAPVAVLSDEYEVVLHCLSILRDLERGAGRIKPFVDVFAILRAVEPTLDWEGFFERRERERVATICVNVLAMTLEFLECADRFPRLAAALDRRRGALRRGEAGSYLGLLAAGRGAIGNKLWTSRVYDCARPTAGAWWLVSLPFRLAVYKPGKTGRVGSAIKRVAGVARGAGREERAK